MAATRPNVGINIEGIKTDPEAVAQVTQSICDVMQWAFDTHASQENLAIALGLLSDTIPSQPLTISGATVTVGAGK